MGMVRLRNGWHGWLQDGGRSGTFFFCREDYDGEVRDRMVSWEIARSKTLGVSLTIDEGTTLGMMFGFGAVYINTGRWRRTRRREVDAYLSWNFGFSATLNLWTDTFASSNPRQWHWSAWALKNRLLGRVRFENTALSTHDVDVVIPGDPTVYPCRVQLLRRTMSRPRWPVKRTTYHADVAVLSKAGIPHRGKGESEWDIDDDALYSVYGDARTVGEAVGKLIARVVDRRMERGWELPVVRQAAAVED